jgi:hypothetical protein
MTPQDHLIIVAAVADERVADLRALLATMTLAALFPCRPRGGSIALSLRHTQSSPIALQSTIAH